jgi:putative cardiolipin synthase
MVGRPQRSFDVVSPYFVPAAAGTASLSALAAGGVQVRIITNSLAATDVTAVHAGYAKRRKPLLQSGVQLFELKPTASEADSESRAKSVAGSSSASLHAKTFAIDGARVFVGSFNFDPRSASLNTEMGVVVDSPTLAGMMKRMFEAVAPRVAYEVRLRADGELEWIERDPAGERRLTSEPGVGLMRRLGVGALSLLPIEWML